MFSFSGWREQRQANALRDTLGAWWWAQRDGRPPCWVVTDDPQHQATMSGLVDGFWDTLGRARSVDDLAEGLAQWDRTVAQRVQQGDLPEALQRHLQCWRIATAPGDAAALRAALHDAYRQRRRIQDEAAVDSLPLPTRHVPDALTQEHWREALRRFGYVQMSSDASLDADGWDRVLVAWTGAHAALAGHLNEPDRSMGAGRWSARLLERVEDDGMFDPASRDIGLTVRPRAVGPSPEGQASAQRLASVERLTGQWVNNLAHERGHALDYWLGERSIAPLHAQRVEKLGHRVQERPVTSPSPNPRDLLVPPAPLSVRDDSLNQWMIPVLGNPRFINGCVGMDEGASYLLRPTEITARFWEGLVRTFEEPPTRPDMTFPALALSGAEQRAVRNALLTAAGLPLDREPRAVPSLNEVGHRIAQRSDGALSVGPRPTMPRRTV